MNLKSTRSASRLGFPGERPSFRAQSQSALHHHLFDVHDRFGRIEALGASLGAVHDRVAAVESKWILKIIEPLPLPFVAGINEPAICLHQNRLPEIAALSPPIAHAH